MTQALIGATHILSNRVADFKNVANTLSGGKESVTFFAGPGRYTLPSIGDGIRAKGGDLPRTNRVRFSSSCSGPL